MNHHWQRGLAYSLTIRTLQHTGLPHPVFVPSTSGDPPLSPSGSLRTGQKRDCFRVCRSILWDRTCSVVNSYGVLRDYTEAAKWFLKAAEQGHASAQGTLGLCYADGQGVPQDYVEAYKRYNLAAAQSLTNAASARDSLAQLMTPELVAEGQCRASQFVVRQGGVAAADQATPPGGADNPKGNGTGFLIADGYILTSYHVVKDADSIDVWSSGSRRRAKVVKVDPANDLALLWRAEDPVVAELKRRRAAKTGGTSQTSLLRCAFSVAATFTLAIPCSRWASRTLTSKASNRS